MAKQPRSIQGRVVAITGGARGIGKSTAQALVARGAKVAIGDIDRELAERTAAELGGEHAGARARRHRAATPSRASSIRSRSGSARSTC